MTFFKFCPSCASTHFMFPDNRRFLCNDCGFTYYHNIAAAIAIVFTFEDKVLFTVRNVAPDKGKWDLPGGFIDPNENAEEAACREIREELGLDLKTADLKYITTSPNNYLYKNVPYRTLDIFYECELTSNEISVAAADEIQKLIWVKRSEIDLNQIGFVSIRKVIGELYLL
jgi:NAD+ diphosphatase